MAVSKQIKKRIQDAGGKFWASDNISAYMHDGDREELIEELVPKFESVLDSLVIDKETILTVKELLGVLLKCTSMN